MQRLLGGPYLAEVMALMEQVRQSSGNAIERQLVNAIEAAITDIGNFEA